MWVHLAGMHAQQTKKYINHFKYCRLYIVKVDTIFTFSCHWIFFLKGKENLKESKTLSDQNYPNQLQSLKTLSESSIII